MKILHLSDLHIGGRDNLLEGADSDGSPCTRRCEVVFDNIIAHCKPLSDYIIVITGDVTDGGSAVLSEGIERQYEEAAELMSRLRNSGFIVLPVPGNHDYGCMGTRPKKKYGRLFREKMLFNYQGAFPILGRADAPGLIDGVAFIGLDSMEAAISRDYYLGAQGKIGNPQLKRLNEMLDAEEVKNASARVIYLHHHPFNPQPNMELHDADGFKKVLSGRKVDILLFGHNHNGWKWNGWWNIARCYDAGTGTRKEGKAGYHRIMDPGGDRATDYDGDFFGNLKKFKEDKVVKSHF
jgi:3',5'-cyclic AMP phosphodiesterase CpdA